MKTIELISELVIVALVVLLIAVALFPTETIGFLYGLFRG